MIISGLVTSFSIFTLAGSALLSALGRPDSFLRWAGLTVLSIVGLGMLVPALGPMIEKPFYRLPKIRGQRAGSPIPTVSGRRHRPHVIGITRVLRHTDGMSSVP